MRYKGINEVNPDGDDLLIMLGGISDVAPANVRRSKKAQEITRSFFGRDKRVASGCRGLWTLVSAYVVKGRNLTSFWQDGVPD